MSVRGALAVLCILCCACAWAIPRSASDSHINGFWLVQNQKGRETVALVTSKNEHVKCTFNYDTFPFTQTKDEKEEELPPSQILAGYMSSHPCLTFKNDHGYQLCIGKNATQEVDGNRATPPLLLGVFKGWTSLGEQTYDEGSKDHCTTSRTFTVQFTCDKTLKIVSVSEPSVCKYRFVVGAPEACGHRVFERLSVAGAGVETWYMEVFEAHDEAIGCVVHAAGFGLPSPTHSGAITDFSLKLEMAKTTLSISSFDARHGLRVPFDETDLRTGSDEGLKPRTLPLPASPNYLAITANAA